MNIKNNKRAEKLISVIGKIVKKYRKKQNKTIYKISAEIGMNKESWREIEYGLKDFRFTTLWRIAEGLDIPAEQLISEAITELGEDFSLTDIK